MAVNPIIQCVARDLMPKYGHSLESSAVYTVPPFFVESLPGRSNRSLPCLLLHMHPGEIFATF